MAGIYSLNNSPLIPMTMNTIITLLFYIAAIVHCLTSRVIAPYLQAIFNELAADVDVPATPMLAVAAPPVKEPATKAPATKTPRPARRRRSTAKVA